MLAWLNHISNLYPYYYSWDMDLLTTEDFLLIGSGYLPDHQVHPGVGMLALLKLLSATAKWLGVLSATKIEDLSVAVNPILVIANTAEWVRAFTPYLIFTIGIAATTALTRYFRLNWFYTLGMLVLFTIPIYASIHLPFSRTEIFAMLFLMLSWSVLLSITPQEYIDQNNETTSNTKYISIAAFKIFLSGILLGLAFFTKIQCLILVAATILLFFHIYQTQNIHSDLPTIINEKLKATIAYLNLIVFLILTILSYSVRVTENVHHMRASFGVTPWWLAALCFFIFSLYIFKRKPKWINNNWRGFVGLTGLIMAGVLASLLVHLFLFSDLTQGLRYMLLTFKICMLGRFVPETYEQLSSARGVDEYFKHKSLLMMYFSILVFLILQAFRGLRHVSHHRLQYPEFLKKTSALLIWLLVAFNIVVATRSFTGQDFVWVELPILFFGLYLVFANFDQAQPVATSQNLILGGFIFFYSLQNILTAVSLAPRSFIGWTSESMYYKNVYGGNQNRIKNIMDLRYPAQVDRQALSLRVRHPSEDLQKWRMVLIEYPVRLQNIGFLQPHLPVFMKNLNLRLQNIPGEWRGASTYDFDNLNNLNNPQQGESKNPHIIKIKNRVDRLTVLFVESRNHDKICTLLQIPDCTINKNLSPEKNLSAVTFFQNSEDRNTLENQKTQAVEFLPIYIFRNSIVSNTVFTDTSSTVSNSTQSPLNIFTLNLSELPGLYFLAQADAAK